MNQQLDESTLQALNCWEDVDYVPVNPLMTQFKRRARLQQTQWRIKQQPTITEGTHPIFSNSKPTRPLGSRLCWQGAKDNGHNFLFPEIADIARERVRKENKGPGEMLNQHRLFADLLSSMPMCFNLFGPLKKDPKGLATRAVKRWWPHVPGTVTDVCFEYSPGRRNGRFLNNGSAFDVAFKLELRGGRKGIFGVETKYHEHAVREKRPRKGASRSSVMSRS
ncbi:hypothetical protein PE066_19050 [Ramlibacter tataouinensis]|nr:hypothetical protein [Ramlibacter tataouinensis]WBY01536.1 hypothetical protein PE066_19050 [Ramlibacter tataouinensis]